MNFWGNVHNSRASARVAAVVHGQCHRALLDAALTKGQYGCRAGGIVESRVRTIRGPLVGQEIVIRVGRTGPVKLDRSCSHGEVVRAARIAGRCIRAEHREGSQQPLLSVMITPAKLEA